MLHKYLYIYIHLYKIHGHKEYTMDVAINYSKHILTTYINMYYISQYIIINEL